MEELQVYTWIANPSFRAALQVRGITVLILLSQTGQRGGPNQGYST
jgi:hypothetical protein